MGFRLSRALVLAACVTMLLAWLPLSPARPASAPAPLPVAEGRFERADRRLTAAADQVVTRLDRLVAARHRLAAARPAFATARAAYAREHRATLAAAVRAARASAAQDEAAQRAAAARAAVHRLARDAYMHSSTGGELALMVGVATSGPDQLGDYAGQRLAVERVQARILAADRAASALSAKATAAYQLAEQAYAAAVQHESAARDAGAAARRRLLAAATAVGVARAAYRSAVRAQRRAEQRYRAARVAVVTARRSAARKAARTRSGPVAPVGAPPSSGNQAALVWRMLRAEGFSEEATAGVLGNLQQESNIDPTTVQFDGPGMGLAQWSRGGRWDNGPNSLLAFAQAAGLDPWDAHTQVQFMVVEMEARWGGFDLDAFKRMRDVVAAAVYFHDVYEVSADTPQQVVQVRGGYALQWYAALAG